MGEEACPLCNSSDTGAPDGSCFHTVDWIAQVSVDGGISRGFTLYQCHNCNLQFKTGIPRDDVYENSYELSKHSNRPLSPDMATARRFDLFEELALKFGRGNRVLDFGCGSGDMLYFWSDNWKKYGVELSDAAQRVATDRGITIVEEESLGRGDDKFGVIVLVDLIEHITSVPLNYQTNSVGYSYRSGRFCNRDLQAFDPVRIFRKESGSGSVRWCRDRC